eukprot:gene8775-10381_t
MENTGGRHYPAAIAIAGALMALFWPNGGWYGILGALAFLAAGGYAWLQLSGGSGSDARSGVQDYLDGRQQFAEQVTPVWCRHIESSRSQMEEAVAELATRFSTIVDKLDDTLRLSNAAADNQDGASLGQVFAHSERQLGEVVATMKSALASKHAMLTRIRELEQFTRELRDMMFRQSNIPKRLIPGTIALGAFTFTMDALPGTPQIQNIIPTAFFQTDTWAAPWLGLIGSVFILAVGLAYLEWRRRQALAKGEGYGAGHSNEPEEFTQQSLPHPLVALLPLVLVGVLNKLFTVMIPLYYGKSHSLELAGSAKPVVTEVSKVAAIWAVEAALLVGIATVLLLAFDTVRGRFAEGSKLAISGALLASMNTASEYGFGAVIAGLPGFLVVADALRAVPNPLLNEAIAVTSLAGITGSASGGLRIALAAMLMPPEADPAANAANIPMEVLHRVASMASGGMDTLPHNGAVITLLAVTGLTHKVSYGDIFVVTCIKTMAVFVVIGAYYAFGIY